MTTLLTALKSKYSTPAQALRALGLSPDLLAADAMPRRRARDADFTENKIMEKYYSEREPLGKLRTEGIPLTYPIKKAEPDDIAGDRRKMRARDNEEDMDWDDVGDEVCEALLDFLHDKLQPEHLRHVLDLLGMGRMGRDQPPRFEGMPEPGGGMWHGRSEGEDRRIRHAMDGASDTWENAFPNASRIRVMP